ncbi:pentapeptide repeat-containing protein [Paenibacillus oleatilyticus]|uniref:Pentapeptide repeat-containing protein n=1 Tax=Paenibacillus oleatilyticus TaxID=2594886 RepID=A0ABV4USY0_9BACL
MCLPPASRRYRRCYRCCYYRRRCRCYLRRCYLHRCRLRHYSLRRCCLHRCHHRRCSLRRCSLRRCPLRRCHLRRCSLRRCHHRRCRLRRYCRRPSLQKQRAAYTDRTCCLRPSTPYTLTRRAPFPVFLP